MKILEAFGEQIGSGGEEMFVLSVLRYADLKDAQVDCLTVFDCISPVFREEVEKRGGNVYALNIVHRWNYFNNYMYRPVKDFLKSHHYDLIHIHSSSIGALAAISAAAKRSGIPFVIAHSHSTGKDNSWKHKVFQCLGALSMRRHVNRFCACSMAAAEWKFGPRIAKRTQIIKNGILVDQFRFDPVRRKEYRQKLNIPDNAFVVGNVGRFSQEKNHPKLIEAFEAVAAHRPDAWLLLVGDGRDMDAIKTMVKEKRLESRVIFTGSVPNVQDYLQAMDVFVFPSLFEGFGIAAIEAITAGLAVVASDRVPRDINVENRAVFLSLDAPADTWAQAIERFSAETRKDYSAIVRAAGYDIHSMADDTAGMYFSAVHNR